jgi:hypothetical protein
VTRTWSLWFVPSAVALLATVGGFIAYRENGIRAGLLVAGAALLTIAGLFALLGPLGFRNDLRMDLKNIELLRTLPIAGPRMVQGQLASSTIALTTAQLVLFVPGVTLLLLSGRAPVPNLFLVAIAVALALPALNAIALGIQNGVTLWIPAWTRIGAEQPGGVEFMGGQIMNLFASVVAFALAMIPPLIVGAIGSAGALMQWGKAAYIPGAIMFIAALYGEVYLLTLLLGRVYDRLDPIESGLTR